MAVTAVIGRLVGGFSKLKVVGAATKQVAISLHHASHCLNNHLRAGVRRVWL
jgi:hypothetical protein